MRIPVPRWLAIVCLAVVVTSASAFVTAAPVGTSFFYQATLSDAVGAASGVFDLRVTLYDAPSGGSVFGGPMTFSDVAVSDGRVMLELDFGAVLDDADRWLKLEVRPGASTGEFMTLVTRQRLKPTPNASHAVEAATASTADSTPAAGDADTLDGKHGAYYRTFANHTGIPTGVEDGDDDALGSLACAADEVPTWGATGWTCGPDRGIVLARSTVVSPVGDAAANGDALLAALAAIPTPTSREEAWLVIIEPGLYDLDDVSLEMKPWVDVAGAGSEATVITSSVCATGIVDPVGTISGASFAELRDLTVVNSCGEESSMGIAVSIDDDAPSARITRVNARAVGGIGLSPSWTAGVASTASDALLEDITAAASSATLTNSAILSSGDETLIIDCIGAAEDGNFAYGLHLTNTSWPMQPSATVSRGSFRASASSMPRAVFIDSVSASLLQVNAAATANGAALYISNNAGDNTVSASRLITSGPVQTDLYYGSLTVIIDQSRIVASGPPVVAAAPTEVRVAASQLWGDPVVGSVTCAGVWDEGWVFYAGVCP